MKKIKYHLRRENIIQNNKNTVSSYCEALRYMWDIIENNENCNLHYVKITNPLSFQTRFLKSGPTYRRNQIPQEKSVAKPGTHLYNVLLENLNMI